MLICEECKQQVTEPETDNRFPFPCFTAIAGALGTAAAFLTGALVMVPAALVAGILADTCHCELCGREIDEGEDSYVPMEALGDHRGAGLFAPAGLPQGEVGSNPGAAKNLEGHDTVRPDAEDFEESGPFPETDESLQNYEDQPRQLRYRYDEFKEKLLPISSPESEDTLGIDYGWSVGPEFDVGGAQAASAESEPGLNWDNQEG